MRRDNIVINFSKKIESESNKLNGIY